MLRPDLARFLEQQGYEIPEEVSRVRPLLFAVGGDPVNSDVLAGVFAQDFEVHAAAASIDVLLSLGTLRPDVLVAAIPMPALDGARLLLAASRSPAMADTLRVAVVARADQATSARRQGAQIAFPCDRLGELYAAVVARVSDRQRRQMV